MKLYFSPGACSLSPHIVLEETGLPYSVQLLDYGTSMKAPAYTALNPMGKVPAVQRGDTVVTEVAAICTWLAELAPDKNLAPPPGSPERGSYYRWLFFVAGPVEAVSTAKEEGWLAQQTTQQALSAGFGRFDDVVRTLELAVSGKRYVCGDHFTAADLYLASYIGWSMMSGTMPKLPAFEAYALPLLQRPASQRGDALDGPMEDGHASAGV